MAITHTILYFMIGIVFTSISLANAFNSPRIKEWMDDITGITILVVAICMGVGYISATGAMVLIEGWAVNITKLDGPTLALFWVFVVLTGVAAFVACMHTEWYPGVCESMEDGASGAVVIFSAATFFGIGFLQTFAIFHWLL